MSGGDWWNQQIDEAAGGDRQTGVIPDYLAPNSTYAPPGESAPIDQWNHSPDPNAPGGWQSFAPGVQAPQDQPNWTTPDQTPPNGGDAANAAANLDFNPTVGADGSANYMQMSSGGFSSLPQQEQALWNNTYGPNSAAHQWAIQSGQAGPNPAGFNALPQADQETWYSVYGAQAPQVWQQQSAANAAQNPAAAAGGGGAPNPYGPSPYAGGSTVPSTNPWSIGAGTSSVPYGQGVPGFGQAGINILPDYMAYLNSQTTGERGGYIPGSGTFNQWNLSQPGLVGTVGGVPNMNLRYGQGGTGDPTTGREVQTPEQWVQGGKLFNSTVTSNWGQTDETRGMDYIANLFLRSDTPSGIGTPAWSAPDAYWAGLGQQIASGRIQPTARGWEALAAKGYTPEKIGGAAPAQAQAARAAGGGAAGGTTGPAGPGTEAFNYQRSYLDLQLKDLDLRNAYLRDRMNQLEIPGMNQLNQREQDKLLFEKAKQTYLEAFNKLQFEESQRQFNDMQGLREGQLTGQYNGQDTQSMQAQKQGQTLDYLRLLGSMRGPQDMFQYMKVLNGTPQGMRDMVNAAAGQYAMPAFGGGATVGGAQVGGGSADINGLLAQMNDPNYGAEGRNLNLPLPNQINALALQRMTPSQQQALVAAYESAGYRPEDVLAIFRQSMPQYQGATSGRVNLFGR